MIRETLIELIYEYEFFIARIINKIQKIITFNISKHYITQINSNKILLMLYMRAKRIHYQLIYIPYKIFFKFLISYFQKVLKKY